MTAHIETTATSSGGVLDPDDTCDEPVGDGWCCRPYGHAGFCDPDTTPLEGDEE